MNIKTYLKKHKIKQRDFAKQIDVTEGFLSNIIKGRRSMPALRAILIERVTNGEITIDELINIDKLG